MEYLLEIIIVMQCGVTLWLSHLINNIYEDLESTMDAHDRLSDAFDALLDILDEEDAQ